VENLVQRFGSFDVPEATSFHYVNANQRRYVYAAHLFNEFGLNWNLAVVIGESDLIDHLMQGIYSTAWVTLALLALAILVGMLTARSMARPILTLGAVASALEKDQLDDRHIDVAQLEKDGLQNNEFGELARTFLRTVKEVEARHTLLEAQLEQLRVDIDPADTQAEVVQVVQSDFFRSLKEQASSLRRQRTQRTRPADPA
jgi:methyl-accepting chemotaxis protein